jgi:hypothetical protein
MKRLAWSAIICAPSSLVISMAVIFANSSLTQTFIYKLSRKLY